MNTKRCFAKCRACIEQALKSKPRCPVCKQPAKVRDLAPDAKVETICKLYGQMEAAFGKTMVMSQLPAADARVLEEAEAQEKKVRVWVNNFQ